MDPRIFALFCTFLGGTGQGVVAPQLPLFLKGAGKMALASGVSATLMYAGIFASSFLFGGLADRGRVNRLMGAGLLGYAATLVLLSRAPSLHAFLAIRALEGVSLSAVFVAADYLLGKLSADDERGRWLSYYGVALSLGLLAGPLLVLGAGGTRALLGVATLSFAAALAALGRLVGIGHDRAGEAGRLGGSRRFGPLAGGMAYGAIEAALVAVLPILARSALGLSPEACLIAIIASAAVASIPWGLATDRFGARPTLLAVLALSAAGPLGVSGHPWLACALFGAMAGGLYPVAFARLLELVPSSRYGAASAAFTRWYGLGSLVGPLAAGAWAESRAMPGLLGWVSLVSFLALLAQGADRRR